MKASMLKSRTGAAVGKVTIEAFRRGFCGQALLPGDAGYDSARRIWNASIDKHPGLIVRCSDAADVVRAVKFSRANNLLVAVKSGGHNVAGRALCDDGIVIDLSAMNRVSVDPELRTVRVPQLLVDSIRAMMIAHLECFDAEPLDQSEQVLPGACLEES